MSTNCPREPNTAARNARQGNWRRERHSLSCRERLILDGTAAALGTCRQVEPRAIGKRPTDEAGGSHRNAYGKRLRPRPEDPGDRYAPPPGGDGVARHLLYFRRSDQRTSLQDQDTVRPARI